MSRSKQQRVQSCSAGKHFVNKADAIAAYGHGNVDSCDRCRGWKAKKRKKRNPNHTYNRGRG